MELAFSNSSQQGTIIALSFCFLVLLVATHNIVISFFSIFVMWAVLVSNMAFIQMVGWSLGTTESIAIVVQIGLSIDYVVHLAAEYSHSRRQTRFEKV